MIVQVYHFREYAAYILVNWLCFFFMQTSTWTPRNVFFPCAQVWQRKLVKGNNLTDLGVQTLFCTFIKLPQTDTNQVLFQHRCCGYTFFFTAGPPNWSIWPCQLKKWIGYWMHHFSHHFNCLFYFWFSHIQHYIYVLNYTSK